MYDQYEGLGITPWDSAEVLTKHAALMHNTLYYMELELLSIGRWSTPDLPMQYVTTLFHWWGFLKALCHSHGDKWGPYIEIIDRDMDKAFLIARKNCDKPDFYDLIDLMKLYNKMKHLAQRTGWALPVKPAPKSEDELTDLITEL